MTSIVTDFKSINRKLNRQEQKAEFEAKNPKVEQSAYEASTGMWGWPYGVAVPLTGAAHQAVDVRYIKIYGGGYAGGMGGVPFDARANVKAVLGDLKTEVALLERLQRAVVKI